MALIASVFGSIALTAFAAGLVMILWLGTWPIETAADRIAIFGRALTISLVGSLVVLITLGFAINRRSIKVSKSGFEAVGGDDAGEVTVAQAVTVSSAATTDA